MIPGISRVGVDCAPNLLGTVRANYQKTVPELKYWLVVDIGNLDHIADSTSGNVMKGSFSQD